MSPVKSYSQWLPILIAGAIYGLAFTVPAADVGVSISGEPAAPIALSGGSAFNLAFTFRVAVWLANPLLWLAAFLLAWRLWPWAALFSAAAVGLAIHSVLRDQGAGTGSDFRSGFWIWTGSMIVLCGLSLYGWRKWIPPEERRSLRQVFAGWRGVAIGSWIATGLAVLAVAWFWNELNPDTNSGRTKTAAVTPETKVIGGVKIILERKDYSGNFSGSWGGNSLNYEIGNHTINFFDGDLTFDTLDYGTFKNGDTIRLDPDGKLFVNDTPARPHPIQPKPVDPAAIALPAVDAGVLSLGWASPTTLVVVTSDHQIRGWDVAQRTATFTLAGPPGTEYLAIAPDGKRIAASARLGDGVRVWDLPATEPKRLNEPREVHGLAFVDHDHLAVSRGDVVMLTRMAEPPIRPISLGAVRDNADRVMAVSGDGRTVARLLGNDTLALNRLKPDAGMYLVEPGRIFEGIRSEGSPVLNRDGSRLFVHREHSIGDSPRGLFVFDTATGSRVSRLKWRYTPGMAVQILGASFSPDGTLLAVAEVDSVRVYDLASGRERAWFGNLRKDWGLTDDESLMWCHGVAFSPDGKYLAVGFSKGKGVRLRVWETAEFLTAPPK